jgi:DNA replication licensing factor MCM2
MAPKRPRESGGSSSGSEPPSDDEDAGDDAPDVDYQPPARGGASADPFLGGNTPEEEDDGEELIGDNMMDDYRPMGALDEYEAEGLDSHQYDDMDFGARAAADAALDARDARENRSRVPKALLTSDDDDGEERGPRRRRRRDPDAAAEYEDPEEAAAAQAADFLDDDGVHINLEDYQGSLTQWIASQPVSEEVKKRFRRFLQGVGADAPEYAQRVRRMCASNSESLEVNYHHLSHAVPILAIWVADAPKEMLKLLDEAAMDTVRIMFPDYDLIHQTVHVRITDLPIEDPIRDLRQAHVGCLVKVSGVVTRRSQARTHDTHARHARATRTHEHTRAPRRAARRACTRRTTARVRCARRRAVAARPRRASPSPRLALVPPRRWPLLRGRLPRSFRSSRRASTRARTARTSSAPSR